ncbi:ABC transporter substrate-binding protein [Acidovorax sp. LjRoot66]|uniref:ABC transporter substrate-binding protein n=1 Tax=Acidovorax sp. LjRoot66 TaxID=3342334 RepID=UPI003ECDB94A
MRYGVAGMAASLTGWTATAAEPDVFVVSQIVDMSAQQQDVSRDFVAGSKAAWQTLNIKGGIRGKKIQHVVTETDGSTTAVKNAWNAALADPRCIAISGCVGSTVSEQLSALQMSSAKGKTLPIIAPWLHSPPDKASREGVFDIFAGQHQQIEFAVRSLAIMGVPRVVSIFSSALYEQQSRSQVEKAASATRIAVDYVPAAKLSQGGYKYQPDVPVVLFLGGTLELHEFIKQMAMPAGRQCYVIALADVNLQVLAQMSKIPSQISVVATQVVPPVTSGTAVVREYRDALSRLFDEEPTPQGLAGFIAAKFTESTIARSAQPWSRSSLLATLRKQEDSDLGGFNVLFEKGTRISQYVTQTVIARDGRVLR